jgi:peptidoglycan-N-acetylglucosamine deacetylase
VTDTRPLLSLGLDLDNLWAYMKIHGDPGWESYPTYLDALAEILIPLARRHDLKLTIFVVGQDAALEKNREAFKALAGAGHEIANHSFRHEPWFHLYSRADIEAEFQEAEEAIETATGQRPKGFRGPGYSLSADTLRVLAARGYLYDCSTLPTFLGPLARAYYFWKSRGMAEAEREKRAKLFGSLKDGLQPIRPYTWRVDGRQLVELPVTTMPVTRVPFHMSYLLYLSRFARVAARAHLATSLRLCRLGGITPSFLLHPLDLLGCDRVKELSFFPGMDLETAAKLEFVEPALESIKRSFRPVTLEEHARVVAKAPEVVVRQVSPEGALG